MRFFASCPKSLEELLAAELTALGASGVKQTIAGVHFEGAMTLAYRACLWSRLASRILLPLLKVDDADNDSLYAQALNFPWEDHIDPRGTIAVDAHGTNEALRNSQYSAQRLKDAICDRLRSVHQARPDIETRDPDVRVHLFIRGSIAQISLDMSGSPLHQRGYRHGSNDAPLKENLGAALLIRAGWPAIAAAGGALVDPFCGSGTLLIEGAWMAADMAASGPRGEPPRVARSTPGTSIAQLLRTGPPPPIDPRSVSPPSHTLRLVSAPRLRTFAPYITFLQLLVTGSNHHPQQIEQTVIDGSATQP